MADAGSTVRGTVDLNTQPARRSLRELRQDARQTNREFDRLGRSIDKVGTQRRSIAELRRELRGMATDVRRSEGSIRASMARKTQSVRDQRTEVRSLRRELRGLGREKVGPNIDLRGIDRALAQVELLIRRLHALSRMRSTPRIAMGGGFDPVTAGGGARAPGGRNTFGGRGGILRSLDLGPVSLNPRALGMLTAVALPAVQQLIGAVGSLTASLAGAAAGFGALGTAAAGAAAVGLGSIAAIAIPVTKQLGEVWKAQESLTSQQQNAVRAGDQHRANLERVRSAHESLASSQRASLVAQERLTEARRDARRELISMALAADRSTLSERRARITVRQSVERQQEVEFDPLATELDQADARLSVREARLGLRQSKIERRWSRSDLRRARRQGVGGMPGVVDARRGTEDARRQLVNARRGLGEAGEEMSRGASQIALAKDELDRAFSRAPQGTRRLLRDVRELQALWGAGSATTRGRARDPGVRAAQGQFVGFLGDQVGAIQKLTPTLGRAGLRSTRALRREGQGFDRFATGGRTQQFIDTGAAMFDENLRSARLFTQYTVETLMNITRASRPFLRDASEFMEHWSKGWRDSTRDIDGTRRRIREMVEHFKAWKRLVGATWNLLRDLGRGAAPGGMGMVDSLTFQIREWDRFVERNPEKVRRFFDNAVNSTKLMASSLREVVQSLSQMAELLRPLLDNFTTLLTGAGNLGLLQPGALALGFGAYRGLRGGGRGRGGAAGAAPGSMVIGGAGGGRGGRRPRISADPDRTGRFPRGGGYQYGGPVSQLGPRTPLTRAGGALGRAGMGALRFGGPSIAATALLTAAGAEGNVFERTQTAFSQFGLAPPVENAASRAEERQRLDESAATGADKAILEHGGYMPRNIREIARQRRYLNGELRTYRQRLREMSPEMRKEMDGMKGTTHAFRAQLRALRDLNREYERRRGARSRLRGGAAAGDVQQAFDIRSRDAGPVAAMHTAVNETLRTQRRLRPEGAKVIAEANLAWARQQAKSNPELLGEVERLENGIKRRFSRLGKHVQIVNGQILTGSKREWKGIYGAITTRAENARQEASASFTQLQRKAIGSLRSMGFSGSQARKIVQGIEQGGHTGASYRHSAETGAVQPQDARGMDTHARGGRLRGRGLRDTVPLASPGSIGAPGEVITNRHTESRVNRMLWQGGFTTTLGREAQREQRAHSERPRSKPVDGQPTGRVARVRRRFARGGIVPVPGFPGEEAASSILDEIALTTHRWPLRLTDAYDRDRSAGHVSPGHNVTGTSADFSGPDRAMDKAVAYWASRGYQVGYDGRFGSQRWSGHGPSYVAGANAHLHVDFGGSTGAVGNAGMAPPGVRRIRLKARPSQFGGVPGALSTRSGQMYAAGLQRKINRKIGAMGGSLDGFHGGGSARANMRLGHRMMRRLWGEDQWPALRQLWIGESGWRNVMNTAGSGATGIPQALPGSKMASAGADWRTNPATQIKWGLGYIKDRYGTPSAALGAWRARSPHWYGRGGAFQARKPRLFGVGDGQPTGGSEHVTVRRVGPGGALRDNAAGGGIRVAVTFTGPVSIRSQEDANALMDKAADRAARKLIAALKRAGVTPDAALAGG